MINRPINDSVMTQSDRAHQSASTNTKIKTESVQKTGKLELYTTAQTVDWQPQRRPRANKVLATEVYLIGSNCFSVLLFSLHFTHHQTLSDKVPFHDMKNY